MACNREPGNSDDRFVGQQEQRKMTRMWRKAMDKMKETGDLINFDSSNPDTSTSTARTGTTVVETCKDPRKFPSEAVQKKLAKGKSMAKVKSPLQRFDEIVTKELNRRRQTETVPSFDVTGNWSGVQFTDLGRGKMALTPDTKLSRGALEGVRKEFLDGDPSDAADAALLDAIEKLAQAEAYCRFDAAVKAAEAATATVPPEQAEEAAMACTKDYQSEIVDVINQKISLTEEKKPIEVIGYIGVTKLRDNM